MAYVMMAVLNAIKTTKEEEQEDQENREDDDRSEYEIDFELDDGVLNCSPHLVRMASSGDSQSIQLIKAIYEIRELRNYNRVSGRANMGKLLPALAQKLGMSKVEAKAYYIAFLAYDIDASGTIDEKEMHLALTDAGVYIHAQEVEGMLKSLSIKTTDTGTIDVESFLRLCKSRQTAVTRNQQRISAFYHATLVQFGVAQLIVLNFIMVISVAWFNPAGKENQFNDVIEYLEIGFTVIFVVELLVNMVSFWFKLFWKSAWNIFDVAIVLASILLLVPSFQDVPVLSQLKLLKPLRIFRLFKRIPSLKRLLQSLGAAVPGVANAFLVLLIVMAIFSVMGVELFQDSDSLECAHHFRDFTQAMYTMFVVATGDGWSADFTLPCAMDFPVAFPFFIVFNMVASFVLINVVVGFLLEKMVIDKTNDPRYLLKREWTRVQIRQHKLKIQEKEEERHRTLMAFNQSVAADVSQIKDAVGVDRMSMNHRQPGISSVPLTQSVGLGDWVPDSYAQLPSELDGLEDLELLNLMQQHQRSAQQCGWLLQSRQIGRVEPKPAEHEFSQPQTQNNHLGAELTEVSAPPPLPRPSSLADKSASTTNGLVGLRPVLRSQSGRLSQDPDAQWSGNEAKQVQSVAQHRFQVSPPAPDSQGNRVQGTVLMTPGGWNVRPSATPSLVRSDLLVPSLIATPESAIVPVDGVRSATASPVAATDHEPRHNHGSVQTLLAAVGGGPSAPAPILTEEGMWTGAPPDSMLSISAEKAKLRSLESALEMMQSLPAQQSSPREEIDRIWQQSSPRELERQTGQRGAEPLLKTTGREHEMTDVEFSGADKTPPPLGQPEVYPVWPTAQAYPPAEQMRSRPSPKSPRLLLEGRTPPKPNGVDALLEDMTALVRRPQQSTHNANASSTIFLDRPASPFLSAAGHVDYTSSLQTSRLALRPRVYSPQPGSSPRPYSTQVDGSQS